MGEIADMMIDGTLDCQTGEYLGPGGGFPRTRKDIGQNWFFQRTPSKEVNGVLNYLSKKTESRLIAEAIIEAYIEDEFGTHLELREACEQIQKEFGAFVDYIKREYKKEKQGK